MQKISALTVTLLLTIIFCVPVSEDIYSQSKNNAFVAIFKDTLLELTENNAKEIGIDIAEKDIRAIIAKDSLISLFTDKDTIWTFDFTISGRRCYGTVISGPTLAGTMKENFSDNILYLYASSEALTSRLINGLFIYNSEEAAWKFRMKAE